jgi:transposase
MGKRYLAREFKIELIKLVRERGVSIREAVADLGLHQKVLRRWVDDS